MAVRKIFDEDTMSHGIQADFVDPKNPTDEEFLELMDSLIGMGFNPSILMKFRLTYLHFKVKIKKVLE